MDSAGRKWVSTSDSVVKHFETPMMKRTEVSSLLIAKESRGDRALTVYDLEVHFDRHPTGRDSGSLAVSGDCGHRFSDIAVSPTRNRC